MIDNVKASYGSDAASSLTVLPDATPLALSRFELSNAVE
jgi:hypothetical protein